MNLDELTKDALRELGDAINQSVEKSADVRDAIARVRALGIEPILPLKLEIAVLRQQSGDESAGHTELELTDEDVKTLRRMKIRL